MKKTVPGWNEDFLEFLGSSPTPFHAVAGLTARLKKAGFAPLEETEEWRCKEGGRYFVVRGGSSLVAFRVGKGGMNIVGAHTDSPCLKLKPSPELASHGYLKLGVEVYGGVLLSTWFDRDLSLAGRVSWISKKRELHASLVDLRRPVAMIPNLAIHLNREVNEKRSINAQNELPPLVARASGEVNFRKWLQDEVGASEVKEILHYDLSFYDVQKPSIVGWNGEFIASARLDNLLSCYAGVRALCESDGGKSAVVVCNDHEEVGSASALGAAGPFLRSVLERIAGGAASLAREIPRSLFLSADNAHGVHPNYPDKHDPRHAPILNGGPVIKINANQRYATTGETAARFAELCQREGVPYQHFVARSDMGCGSTIGPITATNLGIATVDVGAPTFGMHSIREMAGSADAANLSKVMVRFLSE